MILGNGKPWELIPCLAPSSTSRRKHQPIEQQGDGVIWEQFTATAAGLDQEVLRELEHQARMLVEGRLDLQFWISGRA